MRESLISQIALFALVALLVEQAILALLRRRARRKASSRLKRLLASESASEWVGLAVQATAVPLWPTEGLAGSVVPLLEEPGSEETQQLLRGL